MAKLADQVPGLELRILRRDEYPEVMDRYLTNGSRSIPIVIALDEEFRELGHWGPRPRELQAWVMANRATIPKAELYPQVRQWYARDRGETTLREVLAAAGVRPEAVERSERGIVGESPCARVSADERSEGADEQAHGPFASLRVTRFSCPQNIHPLPTENLNPSGPPAKLNAKMVRAQNPERDRAAAAHLHVLGRQPEVLPLEHPARIEERDQRDRAEVAERQQVVPHLEVAEQHPAAGEPAVVERRGGNTRPPSTGTSRSQPGQGEARVERRRAAHPRRRPAAPPARCLRARWR